jgi:hypothetical protein
MKPLALLPPMYTRMRGRYDGNMHRARSKHRARPFATLRFLVEKMLEINIPILVDVESDWGAELTLQ